MSDLFILAGSVLPQKYPKINNIVCLDIYTKNKYGLRYALFDFNITIDKRALIENIDSLLTYLSMTDGKYKYLPISLSHVYHHCLAFQQYEERLNLAIKNMDFQVTSITLSSSFDYVLVEAIKCICNKKNIDYKILDNEFNPAVAPFQYFSNIDIPGKENIDRFDFSIIIALINRTIYKSDVACMNYPNLTNIKLSKISFSYFSLANVQASLRRQTGIPIASGENEFRLEGFKHLFDQGAVDIAMPDIGRVGGIQEARDICSLAKAFGVPVSPHNFSSGVLLAATAHLMFAVPNTQLLEIDMSDNAVYHDFFPEPIQIKDGFAFLSDRPGLGVELSQEILDSYCENS